MTRHPGTISTFEDQSKKCGVRDSINLVYVERIQSIHRANRKVKPPGQKVPQAEIVRQCKALEDQHGPHMFNPFLRLAGTCLCLLTW